jgi:hypothetical protein
MLMAFSVSSFAASNDSDSYLNDSAVPSSITSEKLKLSIHNSPSNSQLLLAAGDSQECISICQIKYKACMATVADEEQQSPPSDPVLRATRNQHSSQCESNLNTCINFCN